MAIFGIVFAMIDWEKQWALHGANFSNGLVHIELPLNDAILRLKPGPGFGDFSHPTTRLVLRMMTSHVLGEDIGSGSGILSLAASSLGAKSVHGIEIDPEAVAHAQENAQLNGLFCTFSLPHRIKLPKKPILLMNMIRSEQRLAYPGFSIHKAFTSGILREEREKYLEMTASWGWKLEGEEEEEGWLGFYFSS